MFLFGNFFANIHGLRTEPEAPFYTAKNHFSLPHSFNSSLSARHNFKTLQVEFLYRCRLPFVAENSATFIKSRIMMKNLSIVLFFRFVVVVNATLFRNSKVPYRMLQLEIAFVLQRYNLLKVGANCEQGE